MLAALLIFVILTISFSALTNVSAGEDPADMSVQTSLLNKLTEIPMFSWRTIINPVAYWNYGKTLVRVLSCDYPGVLTGTTGNLVQLVLIVFEIISFITVVCLINGLRTGNTIVSW